MVVQTATMSTLNPNAPLFIPASFMAAEDFSPEWWRLVETCPAFRDYWLRERFESGDSYDVPTEEEDEFDAIDDLLDIQNQIQFDGLDIADDLAHHKQDNGLNRDVDKDVVSAFIGLDVNSTKSHLMWREPLKHHDKVAHKALKSPRKGNMHRIQQPRA